jgi:hypothetical protein
VVARQVSAFSRTLDGLIGALEVRGNLRIEVVLVGSMTTIIVGRGVWQGFARDDEKIEESVFGLVHTDRMKCSL